MMIDVTRYRYNVVSFRNGDVDIIKFTGDHTPSGLPICQSLRLDKLRKLSPVRLLYRSDSYEDCEEFVEDIE